MHSEMYDKFHCRTTTTTTTTTLTVDRPTGRQAISLSTDFDDLLPRQIVTLPAVPLYQPTTYTISACLATRQTRLPSMLQYRQPISSRPVAVGSNNPTISLLANSQRLSCAAQPVTCQDRQLEIYYRSKKALTWRRHAETSRAELSAQTH